MALTVTDDFTVASTAEAITGWSALTETVFGTIDMFAQGTLSAAFDTGTGTGLKVGGFDNATANSVFIAYIDKAAVSASESFTSVYLADRSIFIRVRDGAATPIKTFETTGTLGSAGGSATAIRTSDA